MANADSETPLVSYSCFPSQVQWTLLVMSDAFLIGALKMPTISKWDVTNPNIRHFQGDEIFAEGEMGTNSKL